MSSIDDLKKNLNIDNFDKNTRNQMFNKFVEKGGKVVSDKKSNIMKFDRNRQRELKKSEEIKKAKYKQNNKQKYSYSNSTQNKPQKKPKKKKYFIIFLLGLFQGVFSFSSTFTKKFTKNMKDQFVQILTETYQITGQILSLNEDKKWQAIEIMNAMNSFYFEIAVRMNRLYKTEMITRIEEYFSFSNNNIICKSIINDLKYIFRELLIIYSFWELSKQVVNECQQIYEDLTSITPLYPKSKVNKNLDKLFAYFFPRLLTIINYNIGTKIPFDINEMHKYAKITPENDMGSITKNILEKRKEHLKDLQKNKEDKIKKLKEEVEKKSVEKIPKYIQKGLGLIDKIVNRIPDKIYQDKNGKLFEANEKLLHFYFLFDEFDKEYSFIMTTSQIKLAPKLESGVRIDMKADLDNLYIRFNEIINFVKEYIKLLESLKKIKDDFKNSPYALQQKIANLHTKRVRSFFEIKGKANTFFSKLASVLQTIIKDYNGEKRLLQNGDDTLRFEISQDKKPKFENVKVINAIVYIFSFVSAFNFYLSNGKLSEGGGLYIQENDTHENNNENTPVREQAADNKNEV